MHSTIHFVTSLFGERWGYVYLFLDILIYNAIKDKNKVFDSMYLHSGMSLRCEIKVMKYVAINNDQGNNIFHLILSSNIPSSKISLNNLQR